MSIWQRKPQLIMINAEIVHESLNHLEVVLPTMLPILGAVIVKIRKEQPVVKLNTQYSGRAGQLSRLFKDSQGNQYIFVPQGAETHVDVSGENSNDHLKIEEFSRREGHSGNAIITINGIKKLHLKPKHIGTRVAIQEIPEAYVFYMGSMRNDKALLEFRKHIKVEEVKIPDST